MKRWQTSILIGVALAALPFLAEAVGFAVETLDYLMLPGLFLASFVFPEGIHSGGHLVLLAIPLAFVSNALVYSLLVQGLLRLFPGRKKSRPGTAGAKG